MTEAPYPSDTRAKGWRFELDHERIRQSDTWALATPELRPWLLMLWMVAWEQTPCGSLPADTALIAARIGMKPKVFAQHKDVLLRGWSEAADGRLYQSTMTAHVLFMLAAREKDAKRAAEYRKRAGEANVTHNGVTRDGGVTPHGRTSDSHCIAQESRASSTPEPIPGTSTGTRSPSGSKGAARRFSAAAIELPDWLDREDWHRWCSDRTARGKSITEEGAKSQLRKLDTYRQQGHSPASVIEHSIAGGYTGLFAPPVKANGSHQSTEERDREAKQLLGFVEHLNA